MKSEEIKNLFAQFEAASAEVEGVECWSARELQTLLGYNKWENFQKVIDKAKAVKKKFLLPKTILPFKLARLKLWSSDYCNMKG